MQYELTISHSLARHIYANSYWLNEITIVTYISNKMELTVSDFGLIGVLTRHGYLWVERRCWIVAGLRVGEYQLIARRVPTQELTSIWKGSAKSFLRPKQSIKRKKMQINEGSRFFKNFYLKKAKNENNSWKNPLEASDPTN